MENKTYIVNGVTFDNAEEAVEYINNLMNKKLN